MLPCLMYCTICIIYIFYFRYAIKVLESQAMLFVLVFHIQHHTLCKKKPTDWKTLESLMTFLHHKAAIIQNYHFKQLFDSTWACVLGVFLYVCFPLHSFIAMVFSLPPLLLCLLFLYCKSQSVYFVILYSINIICKYKTILRNIEV